MVAIKRKIITMILILFALAMFFSAFTIRADAASNIKKSKPKFVTGSCYYSNDTYKAVLKWKKVKGAKKYIIYRSTTKSGKYKKFATTKKTSLKKKSKGEFYYKVKAIKGKQGSKFSDPVHLFPAAGQIVSKMYVTVYYSGTKTTLWVVARNDSNKTMTLPASNASYSICLVDKNTGKVIKEYDVDNVEDYMKGTPITIAKGQDNSKNILVLSTPSAIRPGSGEEIVAKIKFKAGGNTFTLMVKENSISSSTVAAITK